MSRLRHIGYSAMATSVLLWQGFFATLSAGAEPSSAGTPLSNETAAPAQTQPEPSQTTSPPGFNSSPLAPLAAVATEDTVNLPHRKYSLSTCFNKADESNKEILVAAAGLPVAQANIVIAKAIPNPLFNMTYGFGNSYRLIVAGNNQQVGWTEELQVAGRRTKKEGVAQANYLQQAFQVEAVRFDVHNRVRRAYAEQVAAAAYESLTEMQQEIAQRLLDISQKRYSAGKAAGSEVFQAKLLVMQFDIQKIQAQGRLVQDSANLGQLLGETPEREEVIVGDENDLFKLSATGAALVPDPDRGVPPLDQLLPAAWRQRNDLKSAIEHAYSSRRSLTLAKTQRLPDPFIGFNFLYSSYQRSQPQFFDSSFGGVPFQPGYMLTVQEETPIFYHYQGQVKQAEATWHNQLNQVDLQRTQIAQAIVTAYESLQLTCRNIDKFQRDLLPAAEKVAHLARRGYELGKSDLATAVLAQQQYQQLHSQYFDAVVAYQTAWADLERAVGVPLKQ